MGILIEVNVLNQVILVILLINSQYKRIGYAQNVPPLENSKYRLSHILFFNLKISPRSELWLVKNYEVVLF